MGIPLITDYIICTNSDAHWCRYNAELSGFYQEEGNFKICIKK